MIGKNVVLCLAIVSISLIAGLSAKALPMYERTMLPFPDRIDPRDQFMVKEVVSLTVYRDSKDPNGYYYVPPFRVRQYREGAAGMLLNNHNIRQFADAKNALESREIYAADYSNKRLDILMNNVAANEEKVEVARQLLEEAIAMGNERIIALRQQNFELKFSLYNRSLEELLDAQKLMETKGSLLPLPLKKAYNEQIMVKLAAAGFRVPDSGEDDPDEVFIILKDALTDFSETYGGYLSLNAYGGFTRAQLDALVAYKIKYMPHIKISLLPIDKLSFFPLTESKQFDSDSSATNFFGHITGSGDYLGVAIIMDTTLIGSMGLVEHLAPFVPPVGIKVKFKQQMQPTEAELNCDFTSGYKVYGRGDVRDGLIIFDNDVTIKMNSTDHSRGGCILKHISGDPASAEYKALTKLEEELEAVHVRRTMLAYQEKEKYFNGVIDDIRNNRRDSRGVLKTISRVANQNGWRQSTIVQLLSAAADFHWHTNVHDVNNFSQLKFYKRISIRGHETIEKELPLNLCLVYNSQVHAYDRCSEIDEQDAINMQAAIKEAAESEACKNTMDPIECGKERDKTGTPRNGRGSSLHDHNMTEEI